MVSSNDVPRLFLQTMISRRVVSDKLARVLWGKCVEAVKAADDEVDIDYDPKMFDQYVNELNNRLEPVELKLAPTFDEIVGKKLWVLINLEGDGLVQVATYYSPVEIAYFKALVDQIVLASSDCYSVSSMTALREVNSLKPSMSKTQAEVVLADFVAKGWLVKSARGRFSLSSRTLLELQKYFTDNYADDIHECNECHKLLTMGVRCFLAECSGRLHNHCYKQFARSGRKSCPSKVCKADWTQLEQLLPVGEGAVAEGQDSRRTRRRVEEEDETDETDESEEVQPKPKSKPTKKGKVRPTQRKQRLVQEEAEDDGIEDDEEMATDDDQSPAPKSQARRRRR
ncbi:Nse1 non-SMC component of SMC5-6 complex-domain-containing protein [Gautieria morchelliformis]|nr:Nse1 non-SMC component of SMC5-6 complex-domain-containing protein [Gautieria morchelliformis]